jgi:hypothetical protein
LNIISFCGASDSLWEPRDRPKERGQEVVPK